MNCQYCKTLLPSGTKYCPNCGAAVQQQVTSAECENSKSRLIYVLLAIFLGRLGIHNFYIGYHEKAITQIVIFLLPSILWDVDDNPIPILARIAVYIWNIVEIFTVKADAAGRPMRKK